MQTSTCLPQTRSVSHLPMPILVATWALDMTTFRKLIATTLILATASLSACNPKARKEAKDQDTLAKLKLEQRLEEAQTMARPYEWKTLFGKDAMENWEQIEYAGHGPVKFESGTMHIEQGAMLSGARYTGDGLPTKDYEMEVEARRIMGSDFFCCLTFPFRDHHASFVCGGWGGAWIGISSINNMDAYENSTGASYEFDDERWYKVRVRCTENRIQAWIDDKEVVSTNVAGKEVSMRFGEIEDSVPLGISTFTVTAEARNLRLRKLTPEEITAAEELNKADEF